MGLQHSTYKAYGLEIPATTDFDHLDQALADQPDADRLGRVQHTFLGDFEHLFLTTVCEEIEPNTFATVTAEDYHRAELAGWIAALHDMAVLLGYPDPPLPTWLILHDHS